MYIGKRIAKIRNFNNLTQDQFCKALLISRSHLCNIETCRNEPSEDALKRAAAKFGTVKEYFLNHNTIDHGLETLCLFAKQYWFVNSKA